MAAIIDRLTDAQRNKYRTLDALIRTSLNSSIVALAVVRDERLYREEFGTFDAYCRDVTAHGRVHADRNISAAEVNADLLPMGIVLNESAARELAKLTPKQRQKVAEKAQKAAAKADKEARKKAKREGKPPPAKPSRPTAQTYRALAGAALLESMTPAQQLAQVTADDEARTAKVKKIDDEAALKKLQKYGRKVRQCQRFSAIRGWTAVTERAGALGDAIDVLAPPEEKKTGKKAAAA